MPTDIEYSQKDHKGIFKAVHTILHALLFSYGKKSQLRSAESPKKKGK